MTIKNQKNIFNTCCQSIVIINEQGYIEQANHAFFTTTGLTARQIAGKSFYNLFSSSRNLNYYYYIWRELRRNQFWQGEIWLKKADNNRFPSLVNISLYEQGNLSTCYIAFISDLTEQKQKQKRLETLAYYDLLTGLPNRILFNDRLSVAIELAKRNQHQLAILFIDLDNFKPINDQLGHLAGDKLLKCLAHRMQKNIRESDTIARFGGDEFIIILNNTQGEIYVKEVAEKLKSIICEPIHLGQNIININVSIGISLYPEHDISGKGLQHKADLAMYRAKRAHTVGIDFFDPRQFNPATVNHASLAKAL
ncbi:MAG: sensor domain-containing diguanylate cyclase [Proteobacteria bacterium]|nr:sensor domain-containing diguanylate cyclase [Pseudomonadota bacterium]MDE3208461.1 sensor domain-containing diguanylate cyclase [Pseudomonadota bacterium]